MPKSNRVLWEKLDAGSRSLESKGLSSSTAAGEKTWSCCNRIEKALRDKTLEAWPSKWLNPSGKTPVNWFKSAQKTKWWATRDSAGPKCKGSGLEWKELMSCFLNGRTLLGRTRGGWSGAILSTIAFKVQKINWFINVPLPTHLPNCKTQEGQCLWHWHQSKCCCTQEDHPAPV